ncbi:MAG: 3-methyl-2-oxobutanoate dehydrogenase subunit VorB [Anaerolineales bacterium]|jgi:2-oxoglutarate ferredoxin oxidoreductase subunit alpha
MPRELLKGNEAMAEAAVRAGMEAYFGYPITPQTELLEYLSKRMPDLGRTFLQAESEVAAINMVYGAACTWARVMSSSSSPGVSLMMEGISYIAGTEVPVVLIDVVRGGPGLGNIAPSQGDYNQIVHGGGHGDFQPIVLAPSSVQEAIDLTILAFDLAEKYRAIVVVMADGSIGQMMEPAEFPPMQPLRTEYPDWATRGAEGRESRSLSSIYIDPTEEEVMNYRLLQRWNEIQANEIRYKEYFLDDAELVVLGYGTAGRVAMSAVRTARAEGVPVGLFRPISLSPFPFKQIESLSERAKAFLVVEMNSGQMLDDILRAVKGRLPVEFYGRMGGVMPFPDEILAEIHRIRREPLVMNGDPRKAWMNRFASVIGVNGNHLIGDN